MEKHMAREIYDWVDALREIQVSDSEIMQQVYKEYGPKTTNPMYLLTLLDYKLKGIKVNVKNI